MSNTFLISDHHFSQLSIITFKRDDGSKLRDFNSIKEMNDHMISAWNSVISNNDKVYYLGDLCNNAHTLDEVMPQLNGRRKILIKGNHDTLKVSQYIKYFDDIRAYHVLDKLVLSHVPVHPESLSRYRGQIHGHTHFRNVKFPNGETDPRYFNVSVENLNYIPVSFDFIRSKF